MISVLVVDDSAFMRKAVSSMLDKDPEIKVLGIAKNGREGLQMVQELQPDVVTLDIEMPVMDGLTALRYIMMESPRPVLMVSSLTTEGAEATLKALELGAVDYIPKKLSKVSLDIIKIEKELQSKVKAIARRKFKTARFKNKRVKSKEVEDKAEELKQKTQKRSIVGIGVSTGGPPAVQRVMSALPKEFPGSILVAQHMPGVFTGAFAKRLNEISPLNIKEAESGERIELGTVYIAPGGYHLKLKQKGTRQEVEVSTEPEQVLYKPSVNELIKSFSLESARRSVGVILTGMGSDGLEGIKQLKSKGGIALAQSDSTCVVYGMPRAIIEAGLADEIVDIDDMAQRILSSLYK